MAAAKKVEKKDKAYIVKVKNNPHFVGVGAGGVQFANGKAEIKSERMAQWFKEHEGYDVEEIEIKEPDAGKGADNGASNSAE